MFFFVLSLVATASATAIFALELLDRRNRYIVHLQKRAHLEQSYAEGMGEGGEYGKVAGYSEGSTSKQNPLKVLIENEHIQKVLPRPILASYKKHLLRKSDGRMREQIPSALDSLGGAVGSGLSLLQAFEQVARETDEPLGGKLALVPQHVAAGMSIRESLLRLQDEFLPGQMDSLFITLELHHRTGGNLRELLDRTARMQREQQDLYRDLRIKTSQARFSAKIVGVLPVALLVILTLFSGNFIGAFFESPVGFIILCVALIMESAGYLLVRKAAEVEVA